MCGIAGLAGESDITFAAQRVSAMMASLARRGPNGEGLEQWPAATLGHRRLSIYDLSEAGRQPMISEDRTVAVVFNGAIFNFYDLRRELEASGYRFHSRTDTEVLIHGYREWGIDRLIPRLRGMFAIALWDDRAQTLYLVRDRLGVKPLCFTLRRGSVAFASTVRALRQAGFADDIDDQAVADYLEFGYVPDNRTIYRNVSKLPAATILEWKRDSVRQWEYWEPPDPGSNAKIGFEDAVAETERLFLEAVKLRLTADVPVGALLSAGVDSSLVCWAIAKHGGNVKAFTVATPGDAADESADATATARALGLDHNIIEVSSDAPPPVDELVSAFGEPFACASAIGMLRVSHAIAPFATVILTGDGGDDVFLGYPEHKNLWMAQQLAQRLPSAVARLWPLIENAVPDAGPLRRGKHFIDYATGGLGAVTRVHDGWPLYVRHGMLGPRLQGLSIAQRSIPLAHGSARNLLREFVAYDRATRFTGEYLTKVDGATMYHALEARSPFLDHELWSFAAALPFGVRLQGGTLKAILRELVRRKIGERVATGAKRGFTIPVQRWIARDWYTAVRDAMDTSVLARDGFINRNATLARIDAARDSGSAPQQLWWLYVLESWMRGEDATRPFTSAHTSASHWVSA